MVRELLRRGHSVTLLARDVSRVPNDISGLVHVVVGDLADSTALQIGMNQAEAVVHLVGIIRENRRRGITMQAVHVGGTAAVVEAARRAKVERFLHMSALGARVGAISRYHKTKWEAETLVRQSGLKFTIFRPSVVFGPGGPGESFVQQLASVVRRAPVVPILGDGHFLLQPVHTRTVSATFTVALEIDSTIGETFDVGGPAVVEYGEIVRRIVDVIGKRRRSLHIPLPIIEAFVRGATVFGASPLSMDQLTMLKEGSVVTNGERLYRVFGLEPIPFHIAEGDV